MTPGWTWRDGPVEPGPTVVVDIDGVLSDATARQHFLERRPQDWRGFFDSVGEDPLILELAVLLRLLDPVLRIVLLTGRPERVQGPTIAWLERYHVRWDVLAMRDRGDYGAATEFKREILHRLREAGFEPVLALDDDDRNVVMFRDEGVPTIYVHSGYFS